MHSVKKIIKETPSPCTPKEPLWKARLNRPHRRPGRRAGGSAGGASSVAEFAAAPSACPPTPATRLPRRRRSSCATRNSPGLAPVGATGTWRRGRRGASRRSTIALTRRRRGSWNGPTSRTCAPDRAGPSWTGLVEEAIARFIARGGGARRRRESPPRSAPPPRPARSWPATAQVWALDLADALDLDAAIGRSGAAPGARVHRLARRMRRARTAVGELCPPPADPRPQPHQNPPTING